MITSYIARHFDRVHDYLAVALVRYAERELAKPRKPQALGALQLALVMPFALLIGAALITALR